MGKRQSFSSDLLNAKLKALEECLPPGVDGLTRDLLLRQLELPPSDKDGPGCIYVCEVTLDGSLDSNPSGRPEKTMLKIGRSEAPGTRLEQHNRSCRHLNYKLLRVFPR